ncbi:MAG: hypothetical protein ACI81S_002114, partial [Sphingobacteriales bacterium]
NPKTASKKSKPIEKYFNCSFIIFFAIQNYIFE